MSQPAMSWAWSVGGLDPSTKLVLVALADHADKDGLCWPSLRRLAEMTDRNRTTITRALASLEAIGLLRRDRSQGGRKSTRYHLSMGQVHHAPTESPPAGAQHTRSTSGTEMQDAPTAGAPRIAAGAPRTLNYQELTENLPPAPHGTLTARAEQIARRAGELHSIDSPDARRPDGLARWKTKTLIAERRSLLNELDVTDLDVDTAARALLDGRAPTRPDPRGVFIDGAGWCPFTGAAT